MIDTPGTSARRAASRCRSAGPDADRAEQRVEHPVHPVAGPSRPRPAAGGDRCAPEGEILGDGQLVVPVPLEVETVGIPDERPDRPRRGLRSGGHQLGAAQAGRPGVGPGPGQSLHLFAVELGQTEGHGVERRADVAEARRTGGHRQGQQLLGLESGLQAEHGGGELHLVGPEHAGLDEGSKDGYPGRYDHGSTCRTGHGAEGHATLPPAPRPSRRSLSSATRAGGTAHSNTPAAAPAPPP